MGRPRGRGYVQRSHVDRVRLSDRVRLAVVGKGGAGKSVIAATLARLLARRGRRV
ncbi:MAG: hypothetical protein ACR2NB_16040, partial [Solirubrobacteraceae bacterium]